MGNIEQYMIFIWLGIIILAIIIEAFTTELVSIWLAFGGIVSLILSLFDGIPYYAEIIVFVLTSIILLITTRPFVKKYFLKHKTKTNVDTLIGLSCEVTKEINELQIGEVVIHGVTWSAQALDPKITIEKGHIVKIVSISGNKLIVKE